MSDRQKTIKKEISISGVGLHTGEKVSVVCKPAGANSGIRFIRTDLPDNPVVKVEPENIVTENRLPRCTSLKHGPAQVHTVEHLMSALCGMEIDNIDVEIDNAELPGLDGSALGYWEALKGVGVVEQDAARDFLWIKEPLGVEKNGSSIVIVPSEDFRVSYTLDYNHPVVRSQFYSTRIDLLTFENEIAPSRTFCLEQEAEELRKIGLGKGANYDNTLVIGNDGVKSNKVRFDNEFARHKVLDFIGDLYLLGKPIRGNVFAIKSGHTLNLTLLQKINAQHEKDQKTDFSQEYDFGGGTEVDIQEIMRILPHRFPFLLVDRVIEVEKGKRAIGIKNVTINDYFFQGHFPTRPVMPGVLMIEAMAQTAGVTVLSHEDHHGKIAFFMGADKVKFRKVVEPGDQLLLEIEVLRDRKKTALVQGKAKVKDEIVAEAELLFSFTDASYLD